MSETLPPKSAAIPSSPTHGFLLVGNDSIDLGALRIVSRDPVVRVTPKALAVLLELARHQGETVSRDNLLDTVWANTSPTPDVVKQSIMELRKALEPENEPQSIIETISKIGYRLLVPVGFTTTWPPVSNPGAMEQSSGELPVQREHKVAAGNGSSSAGRVLWPIGIFLVAVFAATGLLMYARERPAPAIPEERAAKPTIPVIKYQLLTSDIGPEIFPAVSPDGKFVAYVVLGKEQKKSRVRLQSSDGSSVRWLNPESALDENYPVWSRESSVLAYQEMSQQDGCVIVAKSILGGATSTMSPCWRTVLQYYDWSHDGHELAFSELKSPSHNPGGRVSVLDMRTEVTSYLPYPATELAPDYEPKFSSDARKIIFRRGIQPNNDLFLYDRDTGKLAQITHLRESIKGYAWLPNDKGIVFSSNHSGDYALYSLDLSDGNVVPLGIKDAIYPNISKNSDKLVFSKLRLKRSLVRVPLLKADAPIISALPAVTSSETGGMVSNKGDAFAFVSNRSGQQQLWIKKTSDPLPSQVTNFENLRLSSLQWSPDDRYVMVIAGNGEHSRLYQVDIEKRKIRQLTSEEVYAVQGIYAKSPDRFWLIGHSKTRPWQVWRGEIKDGREKLVATPLTAEFIQQDMETGNVVLLETQRGRVSVLDRNLEFISAPDIGPVMSLRVRAGTLWFFSSKSSGPSLSKVDLRGGRSVSLREGLPFDWTYRNFDIAPDGSYALLNNIETDDTDIAIARLPTSMVR